MHYDKRDIECKCGCGYAVKDPDQLELMERIRRLCLEKYEQEPVVTSWCRCERHNQNVGGVRNSFHVQGIATDFYIPDVCIDDLAVIAEEAEADGIGCYYGSGFLHVDTRGYEAYWEE